MIIYQPETNTAAACDNVADARTVIQQFQNKKMYKTLYHVFATGFDDWHGSYKEAAAQFNRLKKEGHEGVRLYQEDYRTKEDYEDGNLCDENCLLAVGSFPA